MFSTLQNKPQCCDSCNKKWLSEGKSLKQCRQCKLIWYCGPCLRSERKNHKKICKRIADFITEVQRSKKEIAFQTKKNWTELAERYELLAKNYVKISEDYEVLVKNSQRQMNEYSQNIKQKVEELASSHEMLHENQIQIETLKRESEQHESTIATYQNQIMEQNAPFLPFKNHKHSAPFLQELSHLWYFCMEGNCDLLENHICRFEMCSIECQHVLHCKLNDEKGKTSLNFMLAYNGSKYQIIQINNQWIQIQLNTGTRRYLSQKISLTSAHYWTWCSSAKFPYRSKSTSTQALKRHISHYASHFFDQIDLIQIETIYNAKLYLQFKTEYEIKTHQKYNQISSFPTVIPGFHGTSTSLIPSIVENGLHLYYSKKGCFSRGIYISLSADVCNKYYTPLNTETKTKQMLFCLVYIGNSVTVSDPTTKRIINEDRPCEQNGKLLDSINFTHYSAQAYVVPSHSQVYPLAIITYREKNS